MMKLITCWTVICVAGTAIAGDRSVRIDNRQIGERAEVTITYFDPSDEKSSRHHPLPGRFGCLPIGPMEIDCWRQTDRLLCQHTPRGRSTITESVYLNSAYPQVVSPEPNTCLDDNEPTSTIWRLGDDGALSLQIVVESWNGVPPEIELCWREEDVGHDSPFCKVIDASFGGGTNTIGVGIGSNLPFRWMEVRGSVGQVWVLEWPL